MLNLNHFKLRRKRRKQDRLALEHGKQAVKIYLEVQWLRGLEQSAYYAECKRLKSLGAPMYVKH